VSGLDALQNRSKRKVKKKQDPCGHSGPERKKIPVDGKIGVGDGKRKWTKKESLDQHESRKGTEGGKRERVEQERETRFSRMTRKCPEEQKGPEMGGPKTGRAQGSKKVRRRPNRRFKKLQRAKTLPNPKNKRSDCRTKGDAARKKARGQKKKFAGKLQKTDRPGPDREHAEKNKTTENHLLYSTGPGKK